MTREGTGFRNLSPISKYSNITTGSSNVNTAPPETQDGIFNNLVVGVGSYVFKVTEKGMWLGAEDFDDAPFKVSMGGDVTIGGYLSDAYLLEGEAASDINTHTTTISGGKITTGSITADQIAAGAILSEKIGANEVRAINIAAEAISANHVAAGAITGVKLADGSVGEVKIANAAVTGSKIASSTITGSNIASSTITGTKIAGGTITGANISGGTITGVNIQDSSINHTKLSVTSLSAITATLGSVTSGTITGSVIVIPNESGGTTGYLRWSSGSRIWSDSGGNMGYRAVGGTHYFYNSSAQLFTASSYAVDVSSTYLMAQNAIIAYGSILTATGYYIGPSSSYPRIWPRNTSTMWWKGHVDPYPSNTYNLGGSSYYWNYVNAYGFRDKGGDFLDVPLKLRDGEVVDDMVALKSVKPRKDLLNKKTGRQRLDVRTFPEGIFVPAEDHKGKPYKRNKDDVPLVPNRDTGKLEPRPDADSIDLGQYVALIHGAVKMLDGRIEALEKESKKNVKI